jgi:hypothetical protein
LASAPLSRAMSNSGHELMLPNFRLYRLPPYITCYRYFYLSYRLTSIPCAHNIYVQCLRRLICQTTGVFPRISFVHWPYRVSTLTEHHQNDIRYTTSVQSTRRRSTISFQSHTSPLEARQPIRFVWQTTARPRRRQDEQGLPGIRHVQIHFLLGFRFPFRTVRTAALI